MHHITQRIEALRAAQEQSLSQLAQRAGIPRQTLQRRLVAPGDFRVDELDRIAAALGSTSDFLVFGRAA